MIPMMSGQLLPAGIGVVGLCGGSPIDSPPTGLSIESSDSPGCSAPGRGSTISGVSGSITAPSLRGTRG